jgi:hypothetical protein
MAISFMVSMLNMPNFSSSDAEAPWQTPQVSTGVVCQRSLAYQVAPGYSMVAAMFRSLF